MPAARDKTYREQTTIPGAFDIDCVRPSGKPCDKERSPIGWLAAACQGNLQTIARQRKANATFDSIRLHEKQPLEIQGYIRKGFFPEEVAFTILLTGLAQHLLTEKLGLSPRTLQRKVKERKRLSPEESDRLFRLQKLTSAALELFDGDVPAMQQWLKTPLPVLNGESPVSYSDTEPGAQFVLDLIDRLEHGIFS